MHVRIGIEISYVHDECMLESVCAYHLDLALLCNRGHITMCMISLVIIAVGETFLHWLVFEHNKCIIA